MIGPIIAGLGIIVVGGGIGVHAAHRRAVPADVAAQIKAGLAQLTGGTTALLDQYAKAYEAAKNPYRYQVEIALKAARAGDPAHMGADVLTLYRATLASGDPGMMTATAKQLSPKQPTLAANLNDVAKILGNAPTTFGGAISGLESNLNAAGQQVASNLATAAKKVGS